MEGSATKGLELNDCDVTLIRRSRSSIVSRMYVEGYDTSLSGRDLVMSMEEHFGSCGEVLHVYIPGYVRRRILNRFALMYLRGEGAEEKASKLNGSCMGGHKLVVEPYPFHAKHLDHKFSPTRDADNKQRHMVSVVGFDTSLPLEYAESMLYRELSDCGGLESVLICEEKENKAVLCNTAFVHVRGIDALERLVQLCGSYRRGLENIKIFRVVRPKSDEGIVVNFKPTVFDSSPWVPHVDPDLPKPPCLGNLLPEPWKTKIGREFPNLEAFPASTSRYAPEDPNLPKPWKALVDNSTGYGYFWNTETNVTQYQRPSSAPPHLLQGEKMTTQFTA